MKLSVVIPAYNESGAIRNTLENVYLNLTKTKIDHELLVVNDNSSDDTLTILNELKSEIKTLNVISNHGPNGFGYAVRCGLENYKGDCVAIMMADNSDSPDDLIKFYRKMVKEDVDCVFGSRFMKGGSIKNYPKIKLLINRFANTFVRFIFGIKYNDVTNAFKLYKRSTIDGLKPFLAPHFNLTVELPLKAIVRDYSYSVVPNSWSNRSSGKSNLRIREMGSRYFFIFLYCLIEKYFSKGDFKKQWD